MLLLDLGYELLQFGRDGHGVFFKFMLRVWLKPVGGGRTAVSGFPAARLPSPDDSQNPFHRSIEAHERPLP
jgi:hypothetical protein